MDELTALAQMVAIVALTVAPIVLVIRILDGRAPDPADAIALSTALPWPRGVQEEDPQPWRFAPIAD